MLVGISNHQTIAQSMSCISDIRVKSFPKLIPSPSTLYPQPTVHRSTCVTGLYRQKTWPTSWFSHHSGGLVRRFAKNQEKKPLFTFYLTNWNCAIRKHRSWWINEASFWFPDTNMNCYYTPGDIM